MSLERLNLVYFSPVFHTRTLSRMLGGMLTKNLALEKELAEYDITLSTAAQRKYEFNADELVILAAPVYSGRIPALAAERFHQLRGHNTPAVLLVSYGNRAYEDALLELKDIAQAQGFVPVAAAACIAEHTIAPVYATNRPDEEDMQSVTAFSARLAEKLKTAETLSVVEVPGNFPYRACKTNPLPQNVDENCIKCGLCIRSCPAHAIADDDPTKVDPSHCICCMRCVNICPKHARHPAEAMISTVTAKLAPLCTKRRKNEFFTV